MSKREHWSGRILFILAAAGSAIGLGNLWKFPYISWANGGGLFVLLYIFFIILLGLPIMISEIAMGKATGTGPAGAFRALGGQKTPFRFVGYLGVATALLLLSYYSVVAGWSLEYTAKAIGGEFESIPPAKLEQLAQSEAGIQALQTKALKQEIAFATDSQKEEILRDSGLLQANLRDDEMQILFRNSAEKIPALLLEKGKADEWGTIFLNKVQSSEDFVAWRQEALKPLHSDTMFADFLSDKTKLITWHSVIMLITILIVAGGIKGGIENAMKIFMPLLFIIIIFLTINSLLLDKEQEGLRFLLWGDPSRFSAKSIVEALGHAFFSLSLGMGVMITYGSYMGRGNHAVKDSIWIVSADTFVSISATLMIFPIIFVYGMQPTSGGAGILFTALPLELVKFPGKSLFVFIFYILVFIAAITSAISLIEVVVTYLIDEKKMKRYHAALSAGIFIYLLGIPSALWISGFFTRLDFLVSNILLPFGGLLIAIFAGWVAEQKAIENEFHAKGIPAWTFAVYRFVLRIITPVLFAAVFGHLLLSAG